MNQYSYFGAHDRVHNTLPVKLVLPGIFIENVGGGVLWVSGEFVV